MEISEMGGNPRSDEKEFLKNLIMSNDPTAEDCSPDDMVLVDSWEAGDSEHFTWDADPDSGANDVPLYNQSQFTKVLQEFDEDSKDKKESRNKPQNSTCFNCLGDHNLNACDKPRDHQKINKNRREFMNKSGGFHYKRYHLAEDQLYAHMKPGQISNELRKALGLGQYELPNHIYAMRSLGYPPAWLEEIRESKSGLAMHGGTMDEDSQEPSEEQYDVDKVIEFPGFNVPTGPETIDEYRKFRCAPMQPRHSKEALVDELRDRNARPSRPRRLASASPESTPPRHAGELIVLDKDGETDEIVLEAAAGAADGGRRSNTGSPTLEDLETRKQLLMKELAGAVPPPVQSFTPEQTANVGKVKHVDLGTPILKSASPYSKIPAADNFSIGICDVINFENLPDSTGHYLRMNKVIHKIRKFNASKMEDDDGT